MFLADESFLNAISYFSTDILIIFMVILAFILSAGYTSFYQRFIENYGLPYAILVLSLGVLFVLAFLGLPLYNLSQNY